MATPLHYDVFLSYSRKDNKERRDRLRKLLEEKIGLRTFVDEDELVGGTKWKAQIEAHLHGANKPVVVLLASQMAVQYPDNIRDEIEIARAESLTIVPIEFDEGATFRLLGDDDTQHITATKAGQPEERLEDALRRAIYLPGISNSLKPRRDAYVRWKAANAQMEKPFWNTLCNSLASGMDKSQSLALVAPSGYGKSSIAAALAGEMEARDQALCTILLLTENDLKDGGESLARELGARSILQLPELLADYRKHWGRRFVFLLDGLDQYSPDIGYSYYEYASALRRFVAASSTIVTCRPETWRDIYDQHVNLVRPDLNTSRYDTELIQSELRNIGFGDALQKFELMRIPLFIDMTLRFAGDWRDKPVEEVKFLRRLWTHLRSSGQQRGSGSPIDNRGLLDLIAASQVREGRFDVELPVASYSEYEAALIDLRTKRLIVEVGENRLRLRHDSLNAFNMAMHLLKMSPLQRGEFYSHLGKDGIWCVLGWCAALDVDRGQGGSVAREVFELFLRTLDRKDKDDPSTLQKSWDVTFALHERFTVFLPWILEVFATDKLSPSLRELKNHGEPEAFSQIDIPRLTQEAGSTLASAFLSLDFGNAQDAERVLPRLLGKLETWKQRLRIIEAIAKYDSELARDALQKFAEKRCTIGDDWPAAAAALRGLAPHGIASIAFLDRTISQLKSQIEGAQPSSMTNRGLKSAYNAAVRALKEIDPVPRYDELPRDDADLIADLQPLDPQGRPQDWKLVQSAAWEIRNRLSPSQSSEGLPISQEVVTALIGAMGHSHVEPRCEVVKCLALVPTAASFSALLSGVTAADASANMRHEGIAALRKHLLDSVGLKLQALRTRIDREARCAIAQDRQIVADLLWELVRDDALGTDWAFDAGAASLTALSDASRLQHCRVIEHPEPPDATAADLVDAGEIDRAGPEIERKYRFDNLAVTSGSLELVCGPSSWALGRGFHRVVYRDPSLLSAAYPTGAWLPAPLGKARLPGLASVHVVVTTVDNQLLLAQRGAHMSYAPLRWSVSFEEQLTVDALTGEPETPIETARRGFSEEFGISAIDAQIKPLGAIIELDTLNLATLVHLRCNSSSNAVRAAWQATVANIQKSSAKDGKTEVALEIRALDFVEATPQAVSALLHEVRSKRQFHPTARIRLRYWLASF